MWNLPALGHMSPRGSPPRGGSGSGVVNWKEKQTGSPVRAVLMGIGRGVAVEDGGGVDSVTCAVAPWYGGMYVVGAVTCGWSVPSMVASVSVSPGNSRTCVSGRTGSCPGPESQLFWEMPLPRGVGEGPSGMRGEASVEACGSGSGRAEVLSEGPAASEPGGSASSMAASTPVSLNAGSCRGSCVSPTWGALSSDEFDSLDSDDSDKPSPRETCCRDKESQERLSQVLSDGFRTAELLTGLEMARVTMKAAHSVILRNAIVVFVCWNTHKHCWLN